MGAVGALTFLAVADLDPVRQADAAPVPKRIEPPRCTSSTTLDEKISTYDFFGAQASEADRSLRQRLLVSQDFSGQTKRFAGQADWYIEWSTCVQPVAAGCRIEGVTATVHVTYTLPHWADRDGASPALRARWDRYSTSLLTHEKGHGAVALQVGRLLEADLLGLEDLGSCDLLRTETAARVEAVMRRGEAMQNEYDRWTEHGSTQGAVFPF